MVETAGIEPAASTLARRDRCQSCRPHRGAGGIRTRGLLNAIEVLCQLSYSPTAARCSRTDGQRQARRGLPSDAHAVDLSMVKPVLEARRDGETRTPAAQFWRLPFWPLNYVPMQMKTARQVPLQAAPGADLPVLSGNLPDAQGRLRPRAVKPVGFSRSPVHQDSMVSPASREASKLTPPRSIRSES